MTAQQAIQPVTDTIRKVTDPIKAQVAKPDHPFWRKLGKFAQQIAQPVGSILILAFVPAEYKAETTAIWIAACNVFKGATRLTEKK